MFPRLRVPTQFDTNLLTRDEADRAALAADRRRIRFVTLSWFFASGRAMEEAKKEAARIVWPTLWLIPGDDRICCAETSRQIFKSLPDFGDHTWRCYPGLYHEMHNEPEPDRQRVFNDLLDWLRPRSLA
jgi:lysophospholipase